MSEPTTSPTILGYKCKYDCGFTITKQEYDEYCWGISNKVYEHFNNCHNSIPSLTDLIPIEMVSFDFKYSTADDSKWPNSLTPEMFPTKLKMASLFEPDPEPIIHKDLAKMISVPNLVINMNVLLGLPEPPAPPPLPPKWYQKIKIPYLVIKAGKFGYYTEWDSCDSEYEEFHAIKFYIKWWFPFPRK